MYELLPVAGPLHTAADAMLSTVLACATVVAADDWGQITGGWINRNDAGFLDDITLDECKGHCNNDTSCTFVEYHTEPSRCALEQCTPGVNCDDWKQSSPLWTVYVKPSVAKDEAVARLVAEQPDARRAESLAHVKLQKGGHGSCAGRCGADSGGCFCDRTCHLHHDCCLTEHTFCAQCVNAGPKFRTNGITDYCRAQGYKALPPATAPPTSANYGAGIAEAERLIRLQIRWQPGLAAQFLRASFHDAGMFDPHTCMGGAVGCLQYLANECGDHTGLGDFNVPPVSDQKGWEPVKKLKTIKNQVARYGVSMADIFQLAGAVAVDAGSSNGATSKSSHWPWPREMPTHGHGYLVDKLTWGRKDAPQDKCPKSLCKKLPGFHASAQPACFSTNHACRKGDLRATATHIRAQMGRHGNGFSDREIAALLLGGHSIGRARNVFICTGQCDTTKTRHGFGGHPWVPNHCDTKGACAWGNDFAKVLVDRVAKESVDQGDVFNMNPFEEDLTTWWRDTNGDVCQPRSRYEPNKCAGFHNKPMLLDSDAVLEFDKGFYRHTKDFAESNSVFVKAFHDAYLNLGKLGNEECTPMSGSGQVPATQFVMRIGSGCAGSNGQTCGGGTKWRTMYKAHFYAAAGFPGFWNGVKSGMTPCMSELSSIGVTGVKPELVRACPVNEYGVPFEKECVASASNFNTMYRGSNGNADFQIEIRIPLTNDDHRKPIADKVMKCAFKSGDCFEAAGPQCVSAGPTFIDLVRQGAHVLDPNGAAGVSGDPFVVNEKGEKVQFFLPLHQEVELLHCNNMQLYGSAFGSHIEGDHQQWFYKFKIAVDGVDQITVQIKNNATEIHNDTDVSIASQDSKDLTILDVTIEDSKMTKTGALGTEVGGLVAIWHTESGETVQYSIGSVVLQIKSAVAQKFDKKQEQRLYTHLDLHFVEMKQEECRKGVLAEIWGVVALTESTAAMLKPPQEYVQAHAGMVQH